MQLPATAFETFGNVCLCGSLIGLFIWLVMPKKQTSLAPRLPPRAPEPELIPEYLTLHQSMEGILIIGGTGSGKTTGPGAQIARALLRKEVVCVRAPRRLRADR